MVAATLLLLSLGPTTQTLHPDAAWCWFADPRAVWVGGKLITGGVSSAGDIVALSFDPATQATTISLLAKQFERDDHANPSFVSLPNGETLSFFSKHTGPDLITARTSDGKTWSTPKTLALNDPRYVGPKGALNAYCYPNPQYLTSEKKLFLFWRGMNWKPTFAFSSDLGRTWSKGQILLSEPEGRPSNRPYVKVWGDGQRRIHIAFTDGHPRNEPTNSVHYIRYEAGKLVDASGTLRGDLKHLPLAPDQADTVYDGQAEGVRSWVWDVGADSKGNPIVLYSRLPSEDRHEYRYASWNGRRWVDRAIVAAGKWFPQTPEGKTEPEPHYSGGLALDHQDPRIVYVSRETTSGFRVERWFTEDNGDHWSHAEMGMGVRPVVPQGQAPQSGPEVLWMNPSKYIQYTDFQSSLVGGTLDRGPWSAEEPKRSIAAVQHWVMSNPSSYTKTEWMLAPLYSGMLESASLLPGSKANEWVEGIAGSVDWKLGPRPLMADDQAVGQAYLTLYSQSPDPSTIAAVKSWADAMLARAHDEPLEWKNNIHNREWAWCDALYMAPPTLCMLSKALKDDRYANLALRLWQKTEDYLFDPTESLFFRDSRYFKQVEANGKKVFWSRGNGWVLAGAAHMLDAIGPHDPRAVKLRSTFVAMANRLAELQTSDGTWHASLLDPASFPAKETSGTGFICASMAWGVRTGVLPRAKFEPVVRKAFAALTSCVDMNGRLGWVQPIGQDPKLVRASDTDAYGVGAFLQAATQVALMKD